jgi:peptide/nickel transport system permease protein
MGMRDYIAKRLFSTIITIFMVVTINFFLFRVMPANPIDIMINPMVGDERLTDEAREALIHDLGLDRPLWSQYLKYIKDMLSGNFGYSFIHPRPVLGILSERIVNTIILMLAGNVLSILLSIVFGVVAAWKRGTKIDVSTMISALTLSNMPMFWVGGILILIFSVRLDMFPMFGTTTIGATYPNVFAYIFDYFHHLFLPMITMALINFGGLFLIMRSSLLDVFTEDYILTAKAIGFSNRTIIFNNALRNALLPLITIVAIRLGFMISGSLLTETVFSWPGLGLAIYRAVINRDYPVLQGSFFIITVLVVLSNFVADLIYGYADPRVRIGAETRGG